LGEAGKGIKNEHGKGKGIRDTSHLLAFNLHMKMLHKSLVFSLGIVGAGFFEALVILISTKAL